MLVWREPSAVARSLERRDGLPSAVGVALWEEYTRAMLASTAGLPRVCVSYQELVADPVECVARLYGGLVNAGAADLQLPGDDEIRAMIDPALDRHSGSEVLLTRPQSDLRDALRSGAALEWDVVPPMQQETRELLSAFVGQMRENATLRKDAGEMEMLLEAVFASRSWRLGFALTRLWRVLVPSRAEAAVERWMKLRKRLSSRA